MKEKHTARHNCKFCGARTAWAVEDGIKTLVDIPGFGKHICLKTKKSPIELAVAKTKPQTLFSKPACESSEVENDVVFTPTPQKTEIKMDENKVKISYTDHVREIHEKLDMVLDLLVKLVERNKI